MKPRKQEQIFQQDLLRLRLDQRHALYKLSGKIERHRADGQFGSLYPDEGRPGIPTRIMVGLHYLQHAFNLSDEAVVDQWVENPYRQYFCGQTYPA